MSEVIIAQDQGLRGRTIAWSAGQIAVQIYRDVPSLLLLFYMTQVLGISPGLAGGAIFVPKLIVAVLADLGAGWFSDRLKETNRRAHLLLLGAVISPPLLVLLFQAPGDGTEMMRALQVSLVLSAYMIVFSLFSVPHLALGTQISADPGRRTAAMAWRTAMAAVGLLVAASVAPILVERFGGGASGYSLMAWILAAICLVTLLIAWWGSRHIDISDAARAIPQAAAQATGKAMGRWRALAANRAALGLLGAFLCQLCAMGMAYATLAYLFSFNLEFPNPLETIGIMVLLTSVMAMGMQPIWVAVSGKIGRRAVYLLGLLGYTFSLCLIAFAPAGNSLWVYVGGVIMGTFQSACFTTAFSLLSDVIEHDREISGESRAGFFSALFTIIDKVGFALGGTLLVGLVLEFTGFVAGQPTQSKDALSGITFGFALLPAFFNVLSMALLLFVYPREKPAATVS
ncbi:MAG: MFS transporter [Pseudomonadota bacterium]